MKYRPEIDGLRSLAVVGVLAYHFWTSHYSTFPLPGGFLGVDVFFVISGFLITGVIKNSLDLGEFSVLSFYRRRIQRIIPLLLLILVFCLLSFVWLVFSFSL